MTDEQRIVKEVENIKTKLDILQRIEKTGWHPASELPPLGKRVIVWYKTADGMYHAIDNLYTSNGWAFYGMNIIAWCYPPKEE